MPKAIVHAKKSDAKPSKPHPDYPLTPHQCGKRCRKVQGRTYYFGTWDDPDAALREWLDRKDGILAGRDHERDEGEHDDDVAALCNAFVESKRQSLESQDIDGRTYAEYVKVCDRFVAHFGKRRKLSTLRPADFAKYRSKWPKTWGSSTINGEIGRIKTLLKFGYENEIVDRPFRTGENFKRVAKRKLRLEKESKPTKLFTASDIHKLVDAADTQMRAMILLGINSSFGPADCGRLNESAIDWGRQWIERLRHKTAVPQACWLWPETVVAINAAIAQRYENAPSSIADRVFITKRRQAWYREGEKNSVICQAFAKVRTKALIEPEVKALIDAGVEKKVAAKRVAKKWHGIGFYALRHTFETTAGGSKDQIAVNYVMGHCDDSMAAVYREGIDPQRIIDVCSFVRDWFLAGAPEATQ